jgi:hypothetical protein
MDPLQLGAGVPGKQRMAFGAAVGGRSLFSIGAECQPVHSSIYRVNLSRASIDGQIPN